MNEFVVVVVVVVNNKCVVIRICPLFSFPPRSAVSLLSLWISFVFVFLLFRLFEPLLQVSSTTSCSSHALVPSSFFLFPLLGSHVDSTTMIEFWRSLQPLQNPFSCQKYSNQQHNTPSIPRNLRLYRLSLSSPLGPLKCACPCP
jgi:hypothetical protein